MKKQKFKRWRLFADTKVQGQHCLRVACYWLIFQFSMLGTIVVFSFITNSGVALGPLLIPASIVSFLFLPIVLFDAVAFSNRVVGPMVNFRNHLGRILKGEKVEQARFRTGDFYQDICDSFNQLRQLEGSEKNMPEQESDCESGSPKSTPSPSPVVVTTSFPTSEVNNHV